MKRYLKLICIIVLFVAISIALKNYKFIKVSYRYIEENNRSLSFSIFTKTIANDTFFSIPLGKRIIEEGFKKDDILTWHKGLEFTNDRWLFNIIIYLIYKYFGINGIANFVTICTIIIGILLFIVMKNRTKNIMLTLITTLFAMYFSRTVFYSRAQILSFPLFILEFWFLEKLVETGKKRYSIILVIIALLIANIHASVYPIYFVLFMPYFAEWAIKFIKNIKIFDKFEESEVKNIKLIGITFLISLIVGIFTPTGLTPYTILIKAFLYTDTSFIGECQPSNLSNNLPLFIILGLYIAILLLTDIKIKVRDFFFILGFGIMGIRVFRGTFFFHFISSIAICTLINTLVNEYKVILDSKLIKGIIYFSLFLALGSFYLRNYFMIQRDNYIPENMYPIELSEYIIENLDSNIKIFNSFNYGSYLEFKGIKAFIDSRSEVFTDEFNPGCTILEDWLKVNDDSSKYKEIFDKYEITHVVTQGLVGLDERLEKDSCYEKIYADEYFSLYKKIEDAK